MPLERSAILAAALDLIDERGLEGFTLRALGERLGVSQMAAYHHFSGKADIIDSLADELLDRVRLDDPLEVPDPEDRIIGYTHRARTVLLAHPALVPVVAARPLMRPERAEDLTRLHETFSAAGFPDDRIVDAVLTLVMVTLGLILYEQQHATFDRTSGPSYGEDREQLLEEVERDDDASAVGVDLLSQMIDGTWGEQVFTTTIRDCLDGLRRRAGIIE